MKDFGAADRVADTCGLCRVRLGEYRYLGNESHHHKVSVAILLAVGQS